MATLAFTPPKEFRVMLETAEGPLKPLIAIAGFCGLKTAELLRLWPNVESWATADSRREPR
jgi:hypothetical protein